MASTSCTGSDGLEGLVHLEKVGWTHAVISFVDQKDSQLYMEFSERLKQDKPLDEIFSRNRSFSKQLKRRSEIHLGGQDGQQ